MFDREIISFYNDVKDSLWPDITSYADFVHLPDTIKHECTSVFGLEHRKQEICSPDYWIKKTTHVFAYKNVAFVPVPKCASTHYATIFDDLRWEYVSLDNLPATTKLFGNMAHPLQRHIKGVTQWLLQNYSTKIPDLQRNPYNKHYYTEPDYNQLKEHLSNDAIKNLISGVAISDSHTMPYYANYGSLVESINWIPIDTLSTVEQAAAIENFCRLNDVSVRIPVKERLHVSSLDKLEIYQTVAKLLDHSDYKYQSLVLFGKDLGIYYKLLDTFKLDWSHIKVDQ